MTTTPSTSRCWVNWRSCGQIVHVVGPQHQAVLVLFGRIGRAGDELQLGEPQAAIRVGEQKRDDPAALARQAAGQGVRLVAEFFNGLKDALASFLGNGPRPIQGVGHGADGHSGAFSDARHGGHMHSQSTARDGAPVIVETFRLCVSMIVPRTARHVKSLVAAIEGTGDRDAGAGERPGRLGAGAGTGEPSAVGESGVGRSRGPPFLRVL